jgi:hypothetical protein
VPPQAQTPPRSPPGSPIDAQGRTPYVQWVTLLPQVAALLEEVNRQGGVDAIIARLTPRQVDGVLAQVRRLEGQVRALVKDVERMGPVITEGENEMRKIPDGGYRRNRRKIYGKLVALSWSRFPALILLGRRQRLPLDDHTTA